MKSVSVVTATLAGALCLSGAGISRSPLTPSAQKLVDARVRVPLAFEPDRGQWLSRTPNQTLLLTGKEAQMILGGEGESSVIRMKLVGGKAAPETEGLDKLPSTSNYFLGDNPAEWRTAVPHYARVKYKDVYPGIDLVYYSVDRRLEYDFILAPGADPRHIELAYDGADRMQVEPNGDLVLEVNGRTLRQLRPKIYQWVNGHQQEVAGSYRLRNGNQVQFALASYDRTRPLVIDPVLQYSTYLGQEGRDVAVSIATDRNGDIYMTGQTTSVRFQTDQKAQPNPGGKLDAFVGKFSGAGALLWMSYLGGNDNDIGRGIAVDDGGNAYVVGATSSPNFPTRGATNAEFRGIWDAYIAKISPNGQQFLYSTFIGGSGYDDAYSIAVDAEGNAYIAGQTLSFDFPAPNGFQRGAAGGGGDTFVTKISTTRQSTLYSTYVGGSGVDVATGIAIDPQGNAYVTGYTTSQIFPVLTPLQGVYGGEQDAFLYKLNPAGNSLVYSTFLGGTLEDLGFRVAVDSQGSAYVYGHTKSPGFPVRSAVQGTHGGGFDAFVTKVTPEGSATVYSTFLGGSLDEIAFGNIVVDPGGTAYINGYTSSTNFPTRNPIQASYGGGKYDAFVARIGPQGNMLLYSTYMGGSGQDEAYGLAVDRQGQVTVAGGTSSANLPQANNAYSAGTTGEFDIFMARLSADASVNFITSNLATLSFAVSQGTPTATQTITLASGGTPVTFTAGANEPWLRITPESGSTPTSLTISIDPSRITTASASAVITINSPAAANSPLTIPVTLSQTAISSVSPNPVPRSAQATELTLTGIGFKNGLSVRVNRSTVAAQFINATTVRVTVPGNIIESAEALMIMVLNSDGTQTAEFQVPFVSAGPAITAGGIVNGASGLAGPVVPGEIINISGTGFGPATVVNGAFVNGILESTVSETRVLVDNVAAPILYSGPNQLSAVIPYSVLGRAVVDLSVEYKGRRSEPVRLNVGAVSPALFTQNGSGTGQASAVNQDGSFNSASNAAQAGSVITLFGTGEGLSTPAGADGRQISSTPPRPVQAVNATIGGVPATVEYAGGSPGTALGLLQMNVRIPVGVAPGGAVPVQINIGGIVSRDGVTIAVR